MIVGLPFTPLKGLLDGVNATRQEAQKERQAEQKKLHEMEEKNRGQEVVAQALQAEKQALEQALKEARAQAAGRDALARSCKEMAKQAEAARAAAGEAKKEQAARQLFQSHLLSLRAFFPRVAAIQEDVLRDVQALRASYGEDARLCNIAGAATLSRSMLCGAADTLASLNLELSRDGAMPAVPPSPGMPAVPVPSPMPVRPPSPGMPVRPPSPVMPVRPQALSPSMPTPGMPTPPTVQGMGGMKRERGEGENYPRGKRCNVC